AFHGTESRRGPPPGPPRQAGEGTSGEVRAKETRWIMRFHQEDIMATSTRAAVRLVAILGCAFSLAITTAKADPARFTGGPQGLVKSAKGELLEGIMVQLIARKNAVRTTVYSNADGRYAFPALEAG